MIHRNADPDRNRKNPIMKSYEVLFMTSDQKAVVDLLRSRGRGYKYIASEIGVSENTVKSYCRRAPLPAASATDMATVSAKPAAPQHKANTPVGVPAPVPPADQNPANTLPCRWCGKSVAQTPGRKEKLFCSEPCRVKWWNRNRHSSQCKTCLQLVCPTCHKPFSSYGNPNRKYCSQSCYFTDRFHGGAI